MMLPWMAAKILLRPVAELRPHAGNARVHSAEQLEQIKASMLAFGFTNPLLVDEDGVLIAGHGRLEADRGAHHRRGAPRHRHRPERGRRGGRRARLLGHRGQGHTVRGFFAGLKKRQGIEVQVLERVRQVGPNKEGARGSCTVYHLPA
ncbi:MAG: ParB/Srx family N-terminal domain-containing protein [Roseomonas sp.]|nr:ParB/Srx family N-terminal domain-containing protein [Roseomonas sp.]